MTKTEKSTFDLTAWLDGATLAEASVDVFADLKVLGRHQEWERRYEAAQVTAESLPDERSAGEVDPFAELEAEGEAILDALRASKTTWFMAALGSEDEQAIQDAHPFPTAPVKFSEDSPVLVKRPTEVQAEAYLAEIRARAEREAAFNVEHITEIEAHNAAVQAVLQARGAEKIVRSFRRVEAPNGTSSTPLTIEQAKALPGQIGEAQTYSIIQAVDTATQAEPVVPAPFSRKPSETNRG